MPRISEGSHWDDKRILSKFDVISGQLSKQYPSEQTSMKQLAVLTYQLSKFMDTNFGQMAPDELRASFTKLPAELFHDFSESGGLYNILSTCFEFKAQHNWATFDFAAVPRLDSHIELLKRVRDNLSQKDFIKTKKFFFDPSLSQDEIQQLNTIVKKLNGEVVDDQSSATHIVKPDPSYLKSDVNAARVIEKHGSKYMHGWYSPDSYDDLVDNESEIEAATKRNVWTIHARYLLDSAKYNEWMNENDYDLEVLQSEDIAKNIFANAKQKSRKRSASDAELNEQSTSKKAKVENGESTSYSESTFVPTVILPSHSSWFKMEEVNDIEKRAMSEFFDGKNPQKTPEVYKKYRNFMINSYRKDLTTYLTATECRKFLTGDVCSIMRVHQFLEHWGLINYGVDSRNRPFSLDNLSTSHPVDTVHQDYTKPEPSAITATEKLMMFNPSPNVPMGRNNLPQIPQSDWSDEEMLRLLEGVSTCRDNWAQVAATVRTRSKEECILQFAQLPIEDQFLMESDGPTNSSINKSDPKSILEQPLPFADASNPIMSVIAFLSSMVNPSVASAAASAALEAMNKESNLREQQDDPTAVQSMDLKTASAVAIGAAAARARKIVEHEEREIQRLVAFVVEKQLKKLEIKIKHFERLEEAMVKEKDELKKAQKDLYDEKKQFMAQISGNNNSNSNNNNMQQ